MQPGVETLGYYLSSLRDFEYLTAAYPTLKRWAIFDRPCGTRIQIVPAGQRPTPPTRGRRGEENFGLALVPKGQHENSPAIHRWVRKQKQNKSRKGRKKRKSCIRS